MIDLKYSNIGYEARFYFDDNDKAYKTELKKLGKNIPQNSINVRRGNGKRYLNLKKTKTKFDDLMIKAIKEESDHYVIVLSKKEKPAFQVITGPHILNLAENVTIVPIKVSSEKFGKIKARSSLETDQSDYIKKVNDTITSYNMNDCISVFAIEKKEEEISKIICYHIGSSTNGGEMLEEFSFLPINEELFYEIVMIGGNSSNESRELLENIYQNLPEVFKNYKIIGKFINLIEGTNFDYVSANMNRQGQLTYCYE